MTTDDIRAAIAGIKDEEKAVQQSIDELPAFYLRRSEYDRRAHNLEARLVTLASQREHLEGLLKERTE